MALKSEKLLDGLDKTESKFDGFAKNMRNKGLILTGAITGPALTTGGALLKIGADADSMADGIATATGKTGEALDGLVTSATNVFKTIPTDMETAGEAIGELSKLTGQTGKGLEDLAASEIRLAEVTGEDLGAVMTSTTDVFKNWNVAAADQVGTLDKLLIASQQTGIPVSELSDSLAKYGPVLRGMGFTLDESTALLGTFAKAGIDGDKAMSGLRKAFGKFAREGKDPKKALDDVITSIKNAPDDATAAGIAFDTFGDKVGADFVDAIRAGKLGYEDLLKTMDGSDQTVLGLASSTDDAAQKFQVLKNKAIAAAIPLGTQLFESMDKLVPIAETLVGWITKGIDTFVNLPAPVQKVIMILAGLLIVAGPIIGVIGTVITVVTALTGALPLLGMALTLLTGPFAPLIIIVGLFAAAYATNFLGIRDITNRVVGEVIDFFVNLVGWFTGGGLSGIVDTIWGVAQSIIDAGISFVEWYLLLPLTIGKILLRVVGKATSFVSDFVPKFTELPGKIVGAFAGLYDIFVGVGGDIIQGLVDGVAGLLDSLRSKVDDVLGVLGRIPGMGNSPWPTMVDAGQDAMAGLMIGVDKRLPELASLIGDVQNTMLAPQPSPTTPTASAFAQDAGGAGGARSGLTLIMQAGAIVVEGAGNAEAVGDAVMRRILRAADRVEAGMAPA